MHQTRKTHNAHNETQRRLRKLAEKSSSTSWSPIPKFVFYRNEYAGLVPDWQIKNGGRVAIKIHVATKKWECTKSLDSLQEAKEHRFYVKRSKSGLGSFYKDNKKRLHRLWRRTPLDELSYSYKQAGGNDSCAFAW